MRVDELDLPTLVSLTAEGVVRSLLAALADAGYEGVRPSHGYVIQMLVEDEPTISALAVALGITQQGASKQVRDLERLGYVERLAVPGDARAKRVRLTAQGRGVLEAGRSARRKLEATLVRRVGKAESETARAVVAQLLEIVGLGDDVRQRRVPLPAGD